jgi:L-cysteine desulfidase
MRKAYYIYFRQRSTETLDISILLNYNSKKRKRGMDMLLSQQTIQDYKTILTEELLVAMGCTEPISIAYAAAILRKALGTEPTCIHAQLSGNIIKNVKSVIVPATGGLHGIEAAISAGIVAAAPEKKLEVLSVLTAEKQKLVAQYRQQCEFTVKEMETIHPFDLRLTGIAGIHTAAVRIQKNHTNVILVERDGEDITIDYLTAQEKEEDIRTDRSVLNVQDIVTFAETVDLARFDIHFHEIFSVLPAYCIDLPSGVESSLSDPCIKDES